MALQVLSSAHIQYQKSFALLSECCQFQSVSRAWPGPPPQVAFKYVDDLASVWCEWAEMELRHKNFKRALDLMRRATYTPDKHNRREVPPARPSLSTCCASAGHVLLYDDQRCVVQRRPARIEQGPHGVTVGV